MWGVFKAHAFFLFRDDLKREYDLIMEPKYIVSRTKILELIKKARCDDCGAGTVNSMNQNNGLLSNMIV